MPPGEVVIGESMLTLIIDHLTAGMVAGIQVAAPIIAALLLTNLVTGLISRTMPQFNILAVGFSINSMVMLGAMLLSLGVLARVFLDHSFAAIDMMEPVFGAPPP